MAMTMLMILVLSFAFVNMFIMFVILLSYQKKCDKCATNANRRRLVAGACGTIIRYFSRKGRKKEEKGLVYAGLTFYYHDSSCSTIIRRTTTPSLFLCAFARGLLQ